MTICTTAQLVSCIMGPRWTRWYSLSEIQMDQMVLLDWDPDGPDGSFGVGSRWTRWFFWIGIQMDQMVLLEWDPDSSFGVKPLKPADVHSFIT